MAKRGPKPHPDLLTPREQDVLALLRQGLTNPQVAEHLNITPETAKYHVSEILSRLGVSTREEAAAWQPEEPRGWRGLLAPLTLAKAAMLGVALVVVAGLGVLAWGLATSGTGNDNDEIGDLTPAEGITIEDIYQNVQQAATRDGQIVHLTSSGSGTIGDTVIGTNAGYWIDLANETARIEPGYDDRVVIYIDGHIYYMIAGSSGKDPISSNSPTCPNGSFAIGLLLSCSQFDDPAGTEIVYADWDGRQVLAIKYTRASTNEDGTQTGTTTQLQYIDPETWIPLGTKSEARSNTGERYGGGSYAMNIEYLPRETLPDDIFSLEAIGYTEACRTYEFGCEFPSP